MAYHFLSYKYTLARKPARRKHGRTHLHSVSYPSVPSTGSETLYSDRSFQVMVSTNHLPISLGRSGRQHSRSTDISERSHESGASAASGEQRAARTSHSRTRESSSHTHVVSREGHTSTTRFSNDSASSSEEDLPGAAGDNTSRYGTPIRHIPGQYSLVPLDTPQPFPVIPSAAAAAATATSDNNLDSFATRFRALIDEVNQETDAGILLAQNDQSGYYLDQRTRSPSPNMTTLSGQAMEEEAFFIVGGVVQRMPTIESLGSREVMSLATSSNSRDNRSNSLSRPPTRQTMSLFSEGSGSQPPSRANSLSASIALSPPSPLESSFGGTVSELGELQKPIGVHSGNTHVRPSTKSSSSGTYYTAITGWSSTTNGSGKSGQTSSS